MAADSENSVHGPFAVGVCGKDNGCRKVLNRLIVHEITGLVIGTSIGYSSSLLPFIYKRYEDVPEATTNGLRLNWNLPGLSLQRVPERVPKLEAGYHDYYDALFTAITLLSVGAMIGCLLGAMMGETFGRRLVIILASFPAAASLFFLQFGYSNLVVLTMGRILLGICCGIVCVNCPIYLFEIRSDVRGARSTAATFYTSVLWGFAFVAPVQRDIRIVNYVLLGLYVLVWIQAIFCIGAPESPRWLLERGQVTSAENAMLWYNGSKVNLAEDFAKLKNEIEEKSPLDKWTVFSMFRSFVFVFVPTIGGVYGIMFYCSQMFQAVGTPCSIKVSCMLLAYISIFVNVFSRAMINFDNKILLFVSAAGMTVCSLVLAIYFTVRGIDAPKPDVVPDTVVPFLFVTFFLAFYSFGYGPIPFNYVTECVSIITIPKVRSLFAGFAFAFMWVLIYASTLVTGIKIHRMDYSSIYYIWWPLVVTSVLATVFVLWPPFLILNVVGKSKKDIRDFFAGVSANQRSVSVDNIKLENVH